MALTHLTWAYIFFYGQLHIMYIPLLILDELTQVSGKGLAIGWLSLALAWMVEMTRLPLDLILQQVRLVIFM